MRVWLPSEGLEVEERIGGEEGVAGQPPRAVASAGESGEDSHTVGPRFRPGPGSGWQADHWASPNLLSPRLRPELWPVLGWGVPHGRWASPWLGAALPGVRPGVLALGIAEGMGS